MKYLILLIGFAALPAAAKNDSVAAHEVGNGGDAITCQGAEPRVLDYHLAETLPPHFKIATGTGSVSERVNFVLTRLSRLDPRRAKLYQRRFVAVWPEEVQWISGFRFIDLPDAGHLPLTNCTIDQIIIQKTLAHPAASKLTIQQELWQQLDAEAQAGLVLHELIFEEMLALGQNHSKNVRSFNAIISSSEFEQLPASEYEDIVATLFKSPEPISFILDRFTVYAEAGHGAVIDVANFVAPSKGRLTWALSGSYPDWLKIDTSGGRLLLKPPTAEIGTLNFDLIAANQIYSTSAPVRLRLLEKGDLPPIWEVPGIIVDVNAGETKRFDLRPLVRAVGKSASKFSKVLGGDFGSVSQEGLMDIALSKESVDEKFLWVEVSNQHFRDLLRVNINRLDP